MSFSTFPIKLQLFQLILPIAISAFKGLAIKKGEEKKKRKEGNEDKSSRKKKQQSPYLQIMEVCYPQ